MNLGRPILPHSGSEHFEAFGILAAGHRSAFLHTAYDLCGIEWKMRYFDTMAQYPMPRQPLPDPDGAPFAIICGSREAVSQVDEGRPLAAIDLEAIVRDEIEPQKQVGTQWMLDLVNLMGRMHVPISPSLPLLPGQVQMNDTWTTTTMTPVNQQAPWWQRWWTR